MKEDEIEEAYSELVKVAKELLRLYDRNEDEDLEKQFEVLRTLV